jgi:hypothetical protein
MGKPPDIQRYPFFAPATLLPEQPESQVGPELIFFIVSATRESNAIRVPSQALEFIDQFPRITPAAIVRIYTQMCQRYPWRMATRDSEEQVAHEVSTLGRNEYFTSVGTSNQCLPRIQSKFALEAIRELEHRLQIRWAVTQLEEFEVVRHGT